MSKHRRCKVQAPDGSLLYAWIPVDNAARNIATFVKLASGEEALCAIKSCDTLVIDGSLRSQCEDVGIDSLRHSVFEEWSIPPPPGWKRGPVDVDKMCFIKPADIEAILNDHDTAEVEQARQILSATPVMGHGDKIDLVKLEAEISGLRLVPAGED